MQLQNSTKPLLELNNINSNHQHHHHHQVSLSNLHESKSKTNKVSNNNLLKLDFSNLKDFIINLKVYNNHMYILYFYLI